MQETIFERAQFALAHPDVMHTSEQYREIIAVLVDENQCLRAEAEQLAVAASRTEQAYAARDERAKRLADVMANHKAAMEELRQQLTQAQQAEQDALHTLFAVSDEREQLLRSLKTLMSLYVKNQGLPSEFIACITPRSASEMTATERAVSPTWLAWDDARRIIDRCTAAAGGDSVNVSPQSVKPWQVVGVDTGEHPL